ncbi:MAG TPA: exopolysaccharide biosynthesis polyprenyl glycosylphosphotransferase, partial [Bradyrhizobium sp.]|nr:exopolysaccharide biosynthesis polyprenyl glycosylphosphotransferase [Bradyrhizobium sp.]
LGTPLQQQALLSLAIVLPTFLAVAINNQAYSLKALQRPTFGAAKAVEALCYAVAVAIALLFFLKISVQFSRIIFAIGTVFALALTIGCRMVVGKRTGRRYNWTFANELVIADGVEVEATHGRKVVYADQLNVEPRTDDPLALDRLGTLLHNCDRVVVACSPTRVGHWTRALKGTAHNVEIFMPELTRIGAIGLGTLGDEKTLIVNCGPLRLRDRLLKRAIDIVGSTVALIVLAPLIMLVAAAIAIDSPGPILFSQKRVGQNNRIFHLLKFRSMRLECADATGEISARANDNRLTRVGKFIRSTSIDELPQLLNVLLGHMSIVGPRPHALGSTAENQLFWQIEANYFDRHAIKPGITGLAQIRGFRGATLHRKDLVDRLNADLEYVAGWSIWRDLKIIARTFRVVVHPNAY